MKTVNRKEELPDDDWVVYLPNEGMRAFGRALFKMEMAQKELHKITDEMKSSDNSGSNRIR